MVRYKGYRNYRKRQSTNLIRMKFQSFMDIATSAASMQIITISAGGKDIVKRLAPQFGAYKYYKIGNISVKLVPASTLPVDPTGLSIAQGDSLVDPRDQLTPGMMRITNGEDVFEDITGLSDTQQHGIYNNMLLDNRWFKWMLQSGVKRHASPRYWQIGQLHQDKWPGAILNIPQYNPNGALAGTARIMRGAGGDPIDDYDAVAGKTSDPRGLFQVGHRGTLGWLPTDGLQPFYGDDGVPKPVLASPPEVEVMKIILPKAYKTVYYYRMFITETVYFKEPIVNFGVDFGSFSYRPLDVFHNVIAPNPVLPSQDLFQDYPSDGQSGGNYGNN